MKPSDENTREDVLFTGGELARLKGELTRYDDLWGGLSSSLSVGNTSYFAFQDRASAGHNFVVTVLKTRDTKTSPFVYQLNYNATKVGEASVVNPVTYNFDECIRLLGIFLGKGPAPVHDTHFRFERA